MILQDQYILNMASKGQRVDKRGPEDYRKIEVEENPIEKAEGSARVSIGDTVVIAGVKMSIGEPYPDKPDDGVLIVNAEFSPIASPDFETGPPSEGAIELARVVDRGIRESHSIDTKKLCIKKKEKVWLVNVDIHILNHAGNLIDAAGLAAIIALWNSKMPELKGDEIDYEKRTKSLPIAAKPVPITFVKIEGNLFMDPNLEEEEVLGARLTVTTKENGNIVALQKGGIEALTQDEIERAFELAANRSKEIRNLIR